MTDLFERSGSLTAAGVTVAYAFPASEGPAGKLPPDRHHVFVHQRGEWVLVDMRDVYRRRLVRPPLVMTHPYYEFAHRERLEAYARDLAALGLETLTLSPPPPPAPPGEAEPRALPWWVDL